MGYKIIVGCKTALFSILASLTIGASISAAENASNPLAAVNNTDIRWIYTSTGGRYRHDVFVDGAYMLMPTLKLKYELHYNWSNLTGTRHNDIEKFVLKPIFFVHDRQISENWAMRVALGLDWIVEFGNEAKGIGVGADQVGPFGGLAFANKKTGLALIPLVQHFVSYAGTTDINQTAFRIIALQPFGQGYWAKLDAKIPYDWENHRWPLTAEAQLGYNINSNMAVYVDGLIGIGTARPFDGGLGAGLRFKY